MGMIRFPSFLAAGRHAQHAALPFKRSSGGVKVCLISSRETGRWVIPKGWPKAGMAPHELAREEAQEEAGLSGGIGADPLGHFHYRKRLHFFFSITCRVDVYPLCVDSQMASWPEQQWRTRKWATPEAAAGLVDEPELAAIIRAFGDRQADKAGNK